MGKLILEERIKYPPFESYRYKPELLPIAVSRTDISENLSESEALETIRNLPPPFRIGKKSGWLVERRYKYNDETLKLDEKHAQEMLEAVPRDSVVHKQRTGWHLTPNVIHKQARSIMNFSVLVLLIALTYLFLEPVLSVWGVPKYLVYWTSKIWITRLPRASSGCGSNPICPDLYENRRQFF